MYVVIDETEYTEIKGLTFSPEVDLTGNTLPINEFTVDIKTDDSIASWQYAELYDDRDNLWANYWIMKSEKVEKGIVRIVAQSLIAILDKQMMDLDTYNQASFGTLIAGVFAYAPQASYTIDSSFASTKIDGYVPEQSARERLLWLCFAAGAYVKSFFSEKIEILPISITPTLIPLEKTYWKPDVSYSDYVTRIVVKAYSWVQGTPTATDDWITDGTHQNYYIQTATEYALTNTYAPQGAPKNEVRIDNLTLITPDNASQILTRLANYYFNRATVDMSVIDNAEYLPGQKIYGYLGEDEMFQGFIQSEGFSFGLQAKADLHIIGFGAGTGILIDSALLLIKGTWNDLIVCSRIYTFPVGYGYEVENAYVDMTLEGKRYILRPTTAKTSGTMTAGTTEVEVEYETALELASGVLYVVSVDELSGNEVVEIA